MSNNDNVKIFQVSAKAHIGVSIEDEFMIIAYDESPLADLDVKTIKLPKGLGGETANATEHRGVLSLCPACKKIKFCYYCETDKKYDNKNIIVIHCMTKREFLWCLNNE